MNGAMVMPQAANTLAELIKEKSVELSRIIGSPVTSTRPLIAQSRELIESDTKRLIRFGESFQIPEEARLDAHLKVQFNHFLAEPLLREGSLLLDRCLQQRREYDELTTKWFEACVQVDELIRLNGIAEREEKENYDSPARIAEFELKAIKAESDQFTEVLRLIKEEFFNKIDALQATIGRYQWETTNHTGKGEDWVYLEGQRGFKEKIPMMIQQAQNVGLQKTSTERVAGAEQNAGFKASLAKFQRERNEVARLVGLRRAEQLIQPSGALNFLEQMQPIKKRLQNDLVAAWLRLSAAAKGLNQLYQYPIEYFPRLSSDGKIEFDDLVTWCQYTNTWLASFLDTQQQVTCSFSLRQLMTEAGSDFNAGAMSGKWRYRLKERHFPTSRFIRLRSFAIQIDSGHHIGSWNIAIAPPTKAIIRQNVGTVASLEQGHIGTLFLGRVNERTYAVIPESSAPPKLHNASPIGEDNLSGEWGIEILGGSTSGIPASAIQDIDIHLTVALA